MRIGETLCVMQGRKVKNIRQCNTNYGKTGLQSKVKVNNSRIFRPGNRRKFKNSQLQIKFSGSCIKKNECTRYAIIVPCSHKRRQFLIPTCKVIYLLPEIVPVHCSSPSVSSFTFKTKLLSRLLF